MKRILCTRLSLVKPDLASAVEEKQHQQIEYHHHQTYIISSDNTSNYGIIKAKRKENNFFTICTKTLYIHIYLTGLKTENAFHRGPERQAALGDSTRAARGSPPCKHTRNPGTANPSHPGTAASRPRPP